jgi:hypothetical protein
MIKRLAGFFFGTAFMLAGYGLYMHSRFGVLSIVLLAFGAFCEFVSHQMDKP